MATQVLRNRDAQSVFWLDGVGVPAKKTVGEDGIIKILAIEEGVVILEEASTLLVPWGQVINVRYGERIPV